jgi:hypothetical protein
MLAVLSSRKGGRCRDLTAAAAMRTSLLLKPIELGIDLLERHLAVRLQDGGDTAREASTA